MALPDPKQGDIYWVDIPKDHTVGSEQYKIRPYIIISRTSENRNRTVVGVPLTLTIYPTDPPYRISIPANQITRDISYTGEIKSGTAKADQVRVIDKLRLRQKIGTLSTTATIAVGLGLAYLCDIR